MPRHHSTRKGQTVRVKLKSGEVYLDKFKEKNDRYCLTENRREPWSRVVGFAIYRPHRDRSAQQRAKELPMK